VFRHHSQSVRGKLPTDPENGRRTGVDACADDDHEDADDDDEVAGF
jgi:hypothetical protein